MLTLPTLVLTLSAIAAAAGSAGAQTDGTCIPEAERAGRTLGCFITARQELGRLAATPPLYWHIDTYLTRAEAERARGPRSTVVESYGKVWLFTDRRGRAAPGRRDASAARRTAAARRRQTPSPPSTWKAPSSPA